MRKISVALLATLAMVLMLAIPAAAMHESEEPSGSLDLTDVTGECQDAGFDFGFKLDGLDAVSEGTYTFEEGDFSGTIRLIDTDHDGEVDDFEIVEITQEPDGTIVKQPNVGGGISHITFCFNVEPSEPAPSEPTPSEPTPSEPTPSEPTPSEPVSVAPTPSLPTGGTTPPPLPDTSTNSSSTLPMLMGGLFIMALGAMFLVRARQRR